MSYFEENMLENELKCNNVIFGTQNSSFNMCCYSISVILQFLKITDSYERSQILYESTLLSQILYYRSYRLFMISVTDSL